MQNDITNCCAFEGRDMCMNTMISQALKKVVSLSDSGFMTNKCSSYGRYAAP